MKLYGPGKANSLRFSLLDLVDRKIDVRSERPSVDWSPFDWRSLLPCHPLAPALTACTSTNYGATSTIRPRPLDWLRSLGLVDLERSHGNLVRLATSGLTLDLLAVMCDQLAEHLPRSSDPDMALNNLDRFVAAARNPLSIGSLAERDPEALPVLLQIFSTSQHLSDVLIRDTESYESAAHDRRAAGGSRGAGR